MDWGKLSRCKMCRYGKWTRGKTQTQAGKKNQELPLLANKGANALLNRDEGSEKTEWYDGGSSKGR